jgi:amino acid transporter
MGSMIGSGVFIVAADISRQVRSPGLFFLTWIISGLMTIVAAVSYGELAGMMPKAGGQYVYLREAFGPLYGFLYGWTLFLVIQTGTVAAVAVAFGKFLGVFVPWVSAKTILLDLGTLTVFRHPVALTVSSQQLVAILVLCFLSGLNIFGLRVGAGVQNVFTVLKVATLLGVVTLGIGWAFRHPAPAASVQGFWQGAHWDLATLTVVSVALVGPLFSSDAWNNVTFTGSEVINPKRNLPLALFLGTTAVCSIYLACNWTYYRALPFFGASSGGLLEQGIQHAAEDRVATAAIQVMLGGPGAGLMAAAIMVSTFGCGRGARVLCHGERRLVFWPRRASPSPLSYPCGFTSGPGGLGGDPDPDGHVQRTAGLCDFRRGAFLYSDHCRHFPAAAVAPGGAAPLPRLGVPCAPLAVHGFRLVCGVGFAHPQSVAKFCRFEYRGHRHSGLLSLARPRTQHQRLTSGKPSIHGVLSAVCWSLVVVTCR